MHGKNSSASREKSEQFSLSFTECYLLHVLFMVKRLLHQEQKPSHSIEKHQWMVEGKTPKLLEGPDYKEDFFVFQKSFWQRVSVQFLPGFHSLLHELVIKELLILKSTTACIFYFLILIATVRDLSWRGHVWQRVCTCKIAEAAE